MLTAGAAQPGTEAQGKGFTQVRHKGDKRRIEDVANIEGVRNIQNNLRVRAPDRWTLF